MVSKVLLRSWQSCFKAGGSTYFLLRARRWEQWARRHSSSQAVRAGAADWMAAAKASELIVHLAVWKWEVRLRLDPFSQTKSQATRW